MLSVSNAVGGGAAIKLDGWDVIAEQTRRGEGMFCAVHPQSSRICAPTHEMGRNIEGNLKFNKFMLFAILNAIIFERSSNINNSGLVGQASDLSLPTLSRTEVSLTVVSAF